jgi:hypothetical protein
MDWHSMVIVFFQIVVSIGMSLKMLHHQFMTTNKMLQWQFCAQDWLHHIVSLIHSNSSHNGFQWFNESCVKSCAMFCFILCNCYSVTAVSQHIDSVTTEEDSSTITSSYFESHCFICYVFIQCELMWQKWSQFNSYHSQSDYSVLWELLLSWHYLLSIVFWLSE